MKVHETVNVQTVEADAPALPGTAFRRPSRRYLIAKRVFDVTAALVLLVLTAPLWLLIALAIKVDSRGPVLFSQRRVGQGGKEFVMYKFRSMVADADPTVHREAFRLYAAGVPLEADEHGPRFKAARDPRVTRVGRVLRATNLDELPQLLNVLKGQMSLVGPRPAIPYELEWYRPEYFGRFQAPPGITGLWQTKDRFRVGLDEMVRYDLEYVATRSLLLDLRIVLATALAVPLELWRHGRALATRSTGTRGH